MQITGLQPMLQHALEGRYAVGAYNACNAETVKAVIEEGVRQRSPVMLIVSPFETQLVGAGMLVEIARLTAEQADVPVCLHLDHAGSFDEVLQCIDAGFPSVMIDGSQHDFQENIRLTRQVVEFAHPLGITVEGELGAVGRVGDAVEGHGNPSLTDPDAAAEFVERTGVDALAVSIGNAHGIYTQQPELDFERLEAIRRATDIPLILHGGSGTPPEQLHRAVELGICKVNVASEIARAYMNALKSGFDSGGKWYTHTLVEARDAVSQVVGCWMKELGSCGRV